MMAYGGAWGCNNDNYNDGECFLRVRNAGHVRTTTEVQDDLLLQKVLNLFALREIPWLLICVHVLLFKSVRNNTQDVCASYLLAIGPLYLSWVVLEIHITKISI